MSAKNFENIFLTKYEKNLLNEIGAGILCTHHTPTHLIELGLLNNYQKCDNKFIITPKGNRYLEFIEQKQFEEKKNKRNESLRFWISLIVTNLISFAALIVSIIALSKQ